MYGGARYKEDSLNMIAEFIRELAQIEKAKLAEMRAARWASYDCEDEVVMTSNRHQATADRLTAAALGEFENA